MNPEILESKTIHLAGIEKSYDMAHSEVRVLQGVDLDVADGEFVVVLGPSGSGKSTLLNIIGGIDRPTDGEVVVSGQNLNDLNESELAIFRRRNIGFVFQLFNLIPTFSAQENVMLPLELSNANRNEALAKAQDLLEKVDLGDRAEHLPAELSIGEQQRVAIARAIANDPTIILADEPTGNLDRRTGEHILHLLEAMRVERKTTMVIVTHSSSLAERADRTLELVDGKLREGS